MTTKKSKSKNKTRPQILTSDQVSFLHHVVSCYRGHSMTLHWDIVSAAGGDPGVNKAITHLMDERNLCDVLDKVLDNLFCSQFESEQPRTGWVLKPYESIC